MNGSWSAKLSLTRWVALASRQCWVGALARRLCHPTVFAFSAIHIQATWMGASRQWAHDRKWKRRLQLPPFLLP
jgi:hypothetical protein